MSNLSTMEKDFLKHRNESFFAGGPSNKKASKRDIERAELRRKIEDLRDDMALAKEFEL